MGDEDSNRPVTLGDYSRPSHEGYRNAIELPESAKVSPLRSYTIRSVQNGCAFHGLISEDLIQHLKDFLKIVDSIDLNGATRNTTRLRLFCFSFCDQAINWLDRLPARSISTWDDLTTRFLEEFEGQILKLINDQEDQIKQLEEDMRKTKDTSMFLADSLIATLKVKIEAQRVHPTKIEKITRFPTHTLNVTPETLKLTMVHRVLLISKIKPTNYRTPHQHLNSNLKMPILHSFEENTLEYEDEDAVEIKMMGIGMDKESLEHNLYEIDMTSIISHNFSVTSNPPIKLKDPGSFWIKAVEPLTIHIPPSPHVVYLYQNVVFDYMLYLTRRSLEDLRMFSLDDSWRTI
nr:MAK10-like protein [Tanacetum cinerariifolium]